VFAKLIDPQIVQDPQQPGAWIVYLLAAAEVTKEAQETFLNQILGLRRRRAGQDEVAQETAVVFLVKSTDICGKVLIHHRLI
jgi:hypothetical protein